MLKGWRCVRCKVSGKSRKFAIQRNTPTPVKNQNTLAQPSCTNSQPPTIGATAGAAPK